MLHALVTVDAALHALLTFEACTVSCPPDAVLCRRCIIRWLAQKRLVHIQYRRLLHILPVIVVIVLVRNLVFRIGCCQLPLSMLAHPEGLSVAIGSISCFFDALEWHAA